MAACPESNPRLQDYGTKASAGMVIDPQGKAQIMERPFLKERRK